MEAYPLNWPLGWKRTNRPERSRFGKFNEKPSIAKGTNKITEEIRRLGGKEIVISTNLKLKNDGLPYSAQKEPDDRGVAVYFSKRVNSNWEALCIACDTYDKIGCNLYAIGCSIEAMRAMERWGCSEMLNRAFTGFKALPTEATQTVTWWAVLGIYPNATRDQVYATYREAVKKFHPDNVITGNSEKFIQANNAWEEAKRINGWK